MLQKKTSGNRTSFLDNHAIPKVSAMTRLPIDVFLADAFANQILIIQVDGKKRSNAHDKRACQFQHRKKGLQKKKMHSNATTH